MDPMVSIDTLTVATKGYSGADIQALCNEAAMNAVRRQSKIVEQIDFNKATEKVGPTITPDMDKWYQQIAQQVRKPSRPATPIA